MYKRRKNKNGFSFLDSMRLVDWSFNRIEERESQAFYKFSADLEDYVEKQTEKLRKSLADADSRIREIASEALQIAFEHGVTAYFCGLPRYPWIMSICMPDFAEDGYSIELDIREPIRQMLLERCNKEDGFVVKAEEKNILKFAAMLDELSNELKTAIRPENNNG